MRESVDALEGEGAMREEVSLGREIAPSLMHPETLQAGAQLFDSTAATLATHSLLRVTTGGEAGRPNHRSCVPYTPPKRVGEPPRSLRRERGRPQQPRWG